MLARKNAVDFAKMPALKRSNALDAEQIAITDRDAIPVPDGDSDDEVQELATELDKALRALGTQRAARKAAEDKTVAITQEAEVAKTNLQYNSDS